VFVHERERTLERLCQARACRVQRLELRVRLSRRCWAQRRAAGGRQAQVTGADVEGAGFLVGPACVGPRLAFLLLTTEAMRCRWRRRIIMERTEAKEAKEAEAEARSSLAGLPSLGRCSHAQRRAEKQNVPSHLPGPRVRCRSNSPSLRRPVD
jgi:hypothetical protein